MLPKIFFIIIIIFSINNLYSQTNYPHNDFRSPLDITLYMSGNFGELRPNHFHSGIDIRTDGVEGKKMYSIADGYISRIKVSPWGYGNAIYITHTNGYKSVYGHLSRFNAEITAYVKKKQYEQEKFSVNLYPNPDELPVKKGEIFAYSGNSGRSFGPHLHFEIRTVRNDEPINPLLFGFKIKDNIPPKIKTLAIYPENDTSFVNNTNYKKIISVQGSNSKFYINETVTVHGSIYFGIEAYDYLNNVGSRNSVSIVMLYVDDELYYEHEIEKFSFYDSRYINSLVDYEQRISTGKRIQRSYIAPNNKLNIYKYSKNSGAIIFKDNKIHNVKYIVKDTYGNTSSLTFKVQSVVNIAHEIKYSNKHTNYQMLMSYKNENVFIKDNIRIMIHKHCLYDNLYFKFAENPAINNSYSSVYTVHNEYTPLHYPITISINGNKVPENLKTKAIIIRIDRKGKKHSIGGRWLNGFLTAKTKYFGKFYIAIDRIAPIITPLNITEKKNMKSENSIKFKITDELSGINEYNGYIDGKWVLFQYDGKKSTIFYKFDERVSSGKHNLTLKVTDNTNNISEYSIVFYY